MKYFLFVIAMIYGTHSYCQSKSDYVKFLRTRMQVKNENNDFVSFELKGSHMVYRYKSSIANQRWIQEIDIDLKRVDDIIIKKHETDNFDWITFILSGDYVVTSDIEYNGSRNIILKESNWSTGFDKDESKKILSYFKNLATLCGAKLVKL